MYRVELTKGAQRQLAKLPEDIQKRVVAALERSRVRPHAFFERLVGEKIYRLRVGQYRILAQIEDGNLLIFVIVLGHRRNVYG